MVRREITIGIVLFIITYYFSVEGYYEDDVSFDIAVICDAPSVENICDDGLDNDGDYLDDCADPDRAAFCTAGNMARDLFVGDKYRAVHSLECVGFIFSKCSAS